MALFSLDQVLAGFRPPINFMKYTGTMESLGIWHSLMYSVGVPGQAQAPTSALTGDALVSYPGQLYFEHPGIGACYLGRFSISASTNGALLLCDRLWHNANISSTTITSQTINSVTWPARDRNGTTDGEDIIVGIEVSGNTSNGSPITNTTLSYTNSAGTSGRTATITNFPSTAVVGTFVPFELQSGDIGVRSIQSLTLGTSYGTGTIHLVAYRVLARLEQYVPHAGNEFDILTGGCPEMLENTVPFLIWHPSSMNATTIRGQYILVHE